MEKKKRKPHKWNWQPTEADIELARNYSLAGMTYAEMAALFGVSLATFDRRRAEIDEFDVAIAMSKAKGVFDGKNFLYTVMQNPVEKTENRIRAAELFLKSRQVFTDKIEHSGAVKTESAVHIVRLPDNGRDK